MKKVCVINTISNSFLSGRYLLYLTMIFVLSSTCVAGERILTCTSIDGVGMNYDKQVWKKITNIEKIIFDIHISTSGKLSFPKWFFMDNPSCITNKVVPWTSCTSGLTSFVLNTDTGDAVMTSFGNWVVKEYMKNKGLPSPPMLMDINVLSCQNL